MSLCSLQSMLVLLKGHIPPNNTEKAHLFLAQLLNFMNRSSFCSLDSNTIIGQHREEISHIPASAFHNEMSLKHWQLLLCFVPSFSFHVNNKKWETLTFSICIELAVALSLSPSVFVWKEERGAASLIGEGKQPRGESLGSPSGASTFKCHHQSTPYGSAATSRGKREYFVLNIFSSSVTIIRPVFFSLWDFTFSNTASFFLFINQSYSVSNLSPVSFWTFFFLGLFMN